RRRHTRSDRDWSSDVCSSDLWNNRTQQLGARGILERLQAAAERVDEAQPRGVVGFRAPYLVLADVIGDVDEDLVRPGPDIGNGQIGRASCRERGEGAGGDVGV